MTILVRSLLSIAVLAPLATGQERAAPAFAVEAPFVEATALVLDGDGAEWRGERVPDLVIDRPEQLVSLEGRAPAALWRGPADASVRVWLGWNASDLFLCGEVLDDHEQHDPQRWYEGDCIELYLSTADVVAEWGVDDWQVMIAPSWSERPWGVYPRSGQPGRPDGGFGGVEVASQPMDGGYRFEARFPWRSFGRFAPSAGTELGFNFSQCDRDQRGFLETYATWTGEAEIAMRAERRGRLRLQPPPAEEALPALEAPEEGARSWLLAALAALYALALVSRKVWRQSHARRIGLRIGIGAFALAGAVAIGVRIARVSAAEERREQLVAYAESFDLLLRSGLLGRPEPQELLRDAATLLSGGAISPEPAREQVALVPGGATLEASLRTPRSDTPFQPIAIAGRALLSGITLSPAQSLSLPLSSPAQVDGLLVVTRVSDPRYARTSPREIPILSIEVRRGGRAVAPPFEVRDSLDLHFDADSHVERAGLEPALVQPGGPRGELHADALALALEAAVEADEVLVRHVGPPTSYSVQLLAASARVPRAGPVDLGALRTTAEGQWRWSLADPTIEAEVVAPGRTPRKVARGQLARPLRLGSEQLGTIYLRDVAPPAKSVWETAPLVTLASVAPFLVALFAEWLGTRRRLRGKLAVGFAVTSAVPLLALTLLLDASLGAEHRSREAERASEAIARAEVQLEREVRELEREAQRLLRIVELKKRIDGRFPETSEELALGWGEPQGDVRWLERTKPDGRRVRVGQGQSWRALPRTFTLESGPARPFGQLWLFGVAQTAPGAEQPLSVAVARAPGLPGASASARSDVRLVGAGSDPAPAASDLESGGSDLRRGVWDARGGELVGVLVAPQRERGEAVLGRYSLTELLLAAGITAVFTVLLFAGILTGHLVGPIERLDRALRAGRPGEVEPEITDEVGNLAVAVRDYSEQIAERVREMERLQSAQGEMSRRLDPDQAREAILAFFARHTRATGLAILWRGEAGEEPHLHAEGGRELAVPDDALTLQAALVAGEPLSVVDRGQMGVLSEFERAVLGPARRVLCLPLVASGETRGAVVIGFDSDLPRKDQAFLLAAASQSAIVLENARLYRQAVRDAVTGFLSDPGFRQRVADEIQRCGGATGAGVTLLQVHLAGLPRDDERAGERLREAASRLRTSIRGIAVFGRAGAADFKLALPWRGSPPDAEALAARLVDRLTSGPWPDGEAVTGLFCSHATWPVDGPSARFVLAVLEERMAEVQSGLPTVNLVQLASLVPVDFVAASPVMVQLLDTLRLIAGQDFSVLVSGETGVGKDRVAELVHRWSPRSGGPFVHVHCPSLSESLIEDELFGHVKGAFTGAHTRRVGPFEYAAGGTVVLDEVAGLPPAGQVALLRLLESREVQPLGSSTAVKIDVRIVATSSVDLAREVEAGRFRQDLYYRLNVAHVTVPPLRQRRSAIPDLVQAYVRRFNERADRPVTGIDPKVFDALHDHTWPGNLRELENVLARACLLAQGSELGPEHLELVAAEPAGPVSVEDLTQGPLSERAERLVERLGTGDRTSSAEFAEAEGISTRTALRDLQGLVEQGYLIQEGSRRGARFRRTAKALPSHFGP